MGSKRQQNRTLEYAKLILSGKRLCGHSEYLACKRFVDDLARKDWEYVFDVKEAEKHIDIANEMTIVEGLGPTKLVTRGFQNFIIGNIFGWRVKHTKWRRYREAYIQVGRQNGKSFLAGAIANDFCTFSGYNFGRIFCTATKQDQANIVWDEVEKFIIGDADLQELYDIRRHDRTITSKVTRSYIKAIGRDTKSGDGFRSVLAIIDEYHAHPTNQMYELMRDGQIRVDGALVLAITTAGFNMNSPCYQQYLFAKNVLAGAIHKESLFVYIAEMDKEDIKNKDKLWNPDNWAKANPLNLWIDDTHTDEKIKAYMAEKAIDAQRKKANADSVVNFLTKSLNVWVTSGVDALVDAEKWAACAVKKSIKNFSGRKCYLGIDLSSGGDLTSITLLFPPIDDEIKPFIWHHSFIPKLRLQEHIDSDDVPYNIWVNQGLITLTEGGCAIKTDYKYIIAELTRLQEEYKIEIIGCGYDRHNADAFLTDLDECVPCDLFEIVQSAKSLNDATKDFQLSVEGGMVEYDENDGLLTWSVVNAITEQNSFGELKIKKNVQTLRIDPVDSTIDAWKLYWMAQNEGFNIDDANAEMEKIIKEARANESIR